MALCVETLTYQHYCIRHEFPKMFEIQDAKEKLVYLWTITRVTCLWAGTDIRTSNRELSLRNITVLFILDK